MIVERIKEVEVVRERVRYVPVGYQLPSQPQGEQTCRPEGYGPEVEEDCQLEDNGARISYVKRVKRGSKRSYLSHKQENDSLEIKLNTSNDSGNLDEMMEVIRRYEQQLEDKEEKIRLLEKKMRGSESVTLKSTERDE